MIEVEEALNIVIRESSKLLTEKVSISLEDSLGFTLASDVKAKVDSPPFSSSAMDGFALSTEENYPKSIPIDQAIFAGDKTLHKLRPGYAARITTGAPIPDGADVVVPIESCEITDSLVKILQPLQTGENIRLQGEEIKAGEIGLKSGHKITPASVGFMRSLGIFEVNVYKKPKVCIVPTGSELVKDNKPLQHGEIYETNALALSLACHDLKVENKICEVLSDDFQTTFELLRKEIFNSTSNIILISGGVSVGDKDLVKPVLNELGVEQIFWRVNQKPGKPLYFGKINGKLIFGLPGNPAASLTCFYVYVREALGLNKIEALENLPNNLQAAQRAQFLKATINNKKIEVLENQHSHMLSSFAKANALLYVPSTKNTQQNKYFVAYRL